MNRRYETVYIFDSALDEPAINEKLTRFHALLTKDGKGTLSNVSHWGKRTMAYKVKKKDTGYYVVAEFQAAGDLLPERSEEHTSELQSQSNLVCRLLLEKKKNINGDELHHRMSQLPQLPVF